VTLFSIPDRHALNLGRAQNAGGENTVNRRCWNGSGEEIVEWIF
jgi:hypothetical protein